ncbi:hypothetical protein QTP88_002756 [Uroleucon formosanum]
MDYETNTDATESFDFPSDISSTDDESETTYGEDEEQLDYLSAKTHSLEKGLDFPQKVKPSLPKGAIPQIVNTVEHGIVNAEINGIKTGHGIRKTGIKITTWNTLSLYRTGACQNLTDVLDTYGIQIIALQEIRWPGKGQLKVGKYIVYFSGMEERHAFGCGLAVHESLKPYVKEFNPISETITLLRVDTKPLNIILVCVHAPTEIEEENVKICEDLSQIYNKLPGNVANSSCIKDIRSFRGADCDSDHFLVVAKFRLKIQSHKSLMNKNSTKINLEMLKNEKLQQKYTKYVGEYVKNVKLNYMDEEWVRASKAVKEIAMEHVGKIKCSKKKWTIKQYKSFNPSLKIIRNRNNYLIMDPKEKAARWKEYFTELLNADIPDNITRRETHYGAEPMISELTEEETYKAIGNLKNWKSPGSDGIPSELIKYGGKDMHYFMIRICQKIWKDEHLPTTWNEALIENKYEYRQNIWQLFVDFKKAYDSVHRESLYNIIEVFGITKKLVALTKMCMEDTQYRVRVEQTMSEPFEVSTGLKQGDLLSPTLFNLALEKAIREMQRETTGITIGQQRIQILGFADDLNILENSLVDTERAAQVLERATSKIGLKMNMDKTKIMKLLGEEEDNTDTGSLAFEKVNEFRYLGAVLSKNNDWAKEIYVRIIKAERAAFALNKFLKSKVFPRKRKQDCTQQ